MGSCDYCNHHDDCEDSTCPTVDEIIEAVRKQVKS